MAPITDLYILAIEVTQAIQCLDLESGYACPDNSLELDSDRDTAIRVYIGHNGSSPGQDPLSPALKNVTVKISWVAIHLNAAGAFQPYQESQSFDVPWTTDLSTLRDDGRGSATFIIPAKKLGKAYREKVLFVDAEVTAPPGFIESDTQNNTKSIQIGGTDASGNPMPGAVKPHSKLSVEWMLIDYHPKGAYRTGFADPAVAGNAGGLMEKTYPMRVDYNWAGHWLVYDENCAKCVAIQHSEISISNELLMALLWAKSFLTPTPDVLVGWLPLHANGAFSVYGLGTNAGSVAWFVQQSKEYRNQIGLAHEVGHTQGVDHVDEVYKCPSTIVESGFDLTAKAPVPGNTWDYMGAGGNTGWVSPCVWSKMLGQPCNCPGEASTGPGQSWPKPLPNYKLTLIINGGVDRKSGGSIDDLYVLKSRGPFAPSNPDGAYCLEFENAGGDLLARHCFDLEFLTLGSRKPTQKDGFFFRLQFPEGAKRVLLKHGETILAKRVAHKHKPKVRIISPEGGEVPGDKMKIAWSGEHPDGAELHFIVLFSPDAGKSWSPLAVNYLKNSLAIDTSCLRGGKRCRVRILASDGFSTSSADSPVFRLPPTQNVRSTPAPKRYLGNSRSRRVHDLWNETRRCSIARMVEAGHAVSFSQDTRKQANKLGYRSCRFCMGRSPR